MKLYFLLACSLVWSSCIAGSAMPIQEPDPAVNTAEMTQKSLQLDIDNPYAPQEGDSGLMTQNIFVDSTQWLAEAQTLSIAGSLPTPCNELRVTTAVQGSYLIITAYSVYPPDAMCAQVLEPFQADLIINTMPEEIKHFIINGQVLDPGGVNTGLPETSRQLVINNPFAPQAGDGDLIVRTAYLENTEWDTETQTLSMAGNLPTPCNQLRVATSVAGSSLIVTAYSVISPDGVCAQALEPFEADLAINTMPEEIKYFIVNGQVLNSDGMDPEPSQQLEIDNPFAPQAGDGNMIIRNAFLANTEWDANARTLRLSGNLPTPCNELRIATSAEGSSLIITAYSLYPPDAMCTQVVQPFEVTLVFLAIPESITNFIIGTQVIQITQ